jgi:hypothetical protein
MRGPKAMSGGVSGAEIYAGHGNYDHFFTRQAKLFGVRDRSDSHLRRISVN